MTLYTRIRSKLVNFWTFLVLFCVCYSVGSISFSYLISSVQSIERQFEIPSKLSGTLVSANDVGYISTVLFLSYFGSRGNRVRWISVGFFIISCGCLLTALPQFIFGKAQITTELNRSALLHNVTGRLVFDEKLFSAQSREFYEGKNETNPLLDVYKNCDFTETLAASAQMLGAKDLHLILRADDLKTNDICMYNEYVEESISYCSPVGNVIKGNIRKSQCEKRTNNVALGIIFVGIMMIGVGHSMPWTLGLPLLDDSVKSRSAPMYFGLIFMVRIFGPVIGFILGGTFNGIWLDLNTPPKGMSKQDPRWVGAWWLGFVTIGFGLMIPSALLFIFPNHVLTRRQEEGKSRTPISEKNTDQNLIAKETPRARNDSVTKKHVYDFAKSMKMLLKTPIFIGILVGRLFDAMAFKGYITFYPKYLETQFALNMQQSSQIIGPLSITSLIVGLGIGTIVLRKIKLTGRRAMMIVMTSTILGLITTFLAIGIGCDSVINQIGRREREMGGNKTLLCNDRCMCEDTELYPVCDRQGNMYYNPCYAGCRTFRPLDRKTFNFVSLTCYGHGSSYAYEPPLVRGHSWYKLHHNYEVCDCAEDNGAVSRNFCSQNCKAPLYIFFGVGIVGGIIGGISIVPAVLIMLRSVDVSIRSLALGFAGLLTNLLSTLPSPILYGFLIDGTCISKGLTCSGPQSGACEIYDADDMRLRMNLFSGILKIFGVACDCFVFYHAKDLQLFDPDEKAEEAETGESKPASISIENA